MSRTRLIRPAFFKHGELYDAERETGLPLRVAFAGLWTIADREGRFAWKPREIKTDVLPHDPVDFGQVLDALVAHGFVERYEVAGKAYGRIPSFGEHQTFHKSEPRSKLPPPVDHREVTVRPPVDNGGSRADAVTGSVVVAVADTGAVVPPTAPGSLRSNVNGKRLDPLELAELVQRIRRMAKDQRSGPPRIPRTDVEALGPVVFRAYEAIGGSETFVATKPEKVAFLIRDFGAALETAQRHAQTGGVQ